MEAYLEKYKQKVEKKSDFKEKRRKVKVRVHESNSDDVGLGEECRKVGIENGGKNVVGKSGIDGEKMEAVQKEMDSDSDQDDIPRERHDTDSDQDDISRERHDTDSDQDDIPRERHDTDSDQDDIPRERHDSTDEEEKKQKLEPLTVYRHKGKIVSKEFYLGIQENKNDQKMLRSLPWGRGFYQFILETYPEYFQWEEKVEPNKLLLEQDPIQKAQKKKRNKMSKDHPFAKRKRYTENRRFRNRFGIEPGSQWDGKDRASDYEMKFMNQLDQQENRIERGL